MMNNMMQMYQQMMSNPVQFLSRRFNIPQNLNNPNEIIQHLLNTGQVTQEQVNRIQSMKNSPLLRQFMGK